jgi:hypothetical protein
MDMQEDEEGDVTTTEGDANTTKPEDDSTIFL